MHNCTDSDDGNDPWEKGSVSGLTEAGTAYVKDDTCVDESELGEYYCSDKKPVYYSYTCLYGCEDGACRQEPASSCHDSDGGAEFHIYGYCNDGHGGGNYHYPGYGANYHIDSCNGNTLTEYYCTLDHKCQALPTTCPYGCYYGYCLKENDMFEIELSEGWNIISFPSDAYYVLDIACDLNDLAFYWYYPPQSKYYSQQDIYEMYGELNDYYEIWDYMKKASLWLYTPDSCTISYALSPSATAYEIEDLPKMFKGYNMMMITMDMVGQSIDDFSGDCVISSIFEWKADAQAWTESTPGMQITESHISKGLIVKVEGDCNLGEKGIAPPLFPTGLFILKE
jgi:hypothetical protein